MAGAWYARRGRRYYADGPSVAAQLVAEGWARETPAGPVDEELVERTVMAEGHGPDAPAARATVKRRRAARRKAQEGEGT